MAEPVAGGQGASKKIAQASSARGAPSLGRAPRACAVSFGPPSPLQRRRLEAVDAERPPSWARMKRRAHHTRPPRAKSLRGAKGMPGIKGSTTK